MQLGQSRQARQATQLRQFGLSGHGDMLLSASISITPSKAAGGHLSVSWGVTTLGLPRRGLRFQLADLADSQMIAMYSMLPNIKLVGLADYSDACGVCLNSIT